jgi:hypothetical protein
LSAPVSGLFYTAEVGTVREARGEKFVDRTGRSLVAVGNTALKPGGPTRADVRSVAIEGLGGGASGPSTGLHAGG